MKKGIVKLVIYAHLQRQYLYFRFLQLRHLETTNNCAAETTVEAEVLLHNITGRNCYNSKCRWH